MTDTLNSLADYCGIADEYHDIWGGHHPTSIKTRQALLGAMHLSTDIDPAVVQQSLVAAEWRSALPPVCVVRIGAEARLPLILPAAERAAVWRWELILETGERSDADFVPADFVLLAERELDGIALQRHELVLPPVATMGYHRLRLLTEDGNEAASLAYMVVPERCHLPTAIESGRRLWGLTVQLYGVRSLRNWGIGDFTDLAGLIDFTAAAGGDIVGVNPLHALFPDNPAHISPYSPSQRSGFNVLYLDVEAVPEFAVCEPAQRRVASADFQARLAELRDTPLVDYPGVAAVKLDILRLLFAHFRAAGGPRVAAFADWRQAQGDALERLALYEALQAHWRTADPTVWGWPVWPQEYRSPTSPAVAEFAVSHAEAIDWHAWLQWQADLQLAEVSARARQHGLAAGLYQDLAVGANPGGAEVWRWQEVFMTGTGVSNATGASPAGAHAGAPPDEINLMGQDWGLPPFVPSRLREAAYQPFIDILRANMKHAGALRIDHVMGLMRVFCVPAGIPASEGAYVYYPFEDLLGIVALESRRNQCLVIGEDLGTVPEGFRPRLAECGVLSYHPMIFERYEDGNFRLPAEVPPQALVAVSTHDLPTLRGFWRGEDIVARTELHLFPNDELRNRFITERDWDRGRLLWALERENLLPKGVSKDLNAMPDLTDDTIVAIHAFLARTPSMVLVVQPEDMFGVLEQPNLPGTLEHQHPNWQRRLPVALEDWAAQARFRDLFEAMRRENRSHS
jgi:(1->4)-alpha-D-glucan 1-alpha-D-glucosylmutase